MNAYAEMKERHQQRVNALPLKFAFGMKQFREMMESWGLTENDTDKIYKMGGSGGFYLRTDSKLIFATLEENEIEMQAAIRNDIDGSGFIKDMFSYELANHEYCVTFDLEPTLDALGVTIDEVNNSPALLNGLLLAKNEYLKQAEENGWY